MKRNYRIIVVFLSVIIMMVAGVWVYSSTQQEASSAVAVHSEDDGHNHQADAQEARDICSEHHVLESECPFCNESLVKKMGMCQEHGVPEALCTRCKPKMEAAFKAEGDWCGEHNLPESQCAKCNPNSINSQGGDDGHGHAEEAGHGHEGEAGGEEHVDEVTLTPEAIKQNRIRSEALRQHPLSHDLTIPASISYNLEAMAHVGTPVEGRVAELHVKLGDDVKKGDALLTVDSPALGEAQSNFLQKRTQVEVARINVEIKQKDEERAKRVLEGKGIALGEYQRQEGEYKTALGELKSAEAALIAAKNHLHLWGVDDQMLASLIESGEVNPRYSVRAPFDGRVIEREATLGEMVNTEREALLVLANLETLWILANVPESHVHRLQVGSPARVTVSALPGENIEGKIGYISSSLNEQTRTAQVRVEIQEGKLPLKPGMFAQVQLLLDHDQATTKSVTLAVPKSAIQNFEGGQAVFIAEPNEPGTFTARQVKTGASDGKLVAILEGVEEGAQVVVDGAFVIKAELAKGEMAGKTCSGH